MYIEMTLTSKDIIINSVEQTTPSVIEFFLNHYIKLNWKSNWVAGTYSLNDAVRHNGKAWIANKSTTQEPTLTSDDWGLMVVDGVGLIDVNLIEYIGGTAFYQMIFSDGSTFEYSISDGEKGDPGISVINYELITTAGLEKTYRFTLSNGSFYDFTIKDGENGKNPEFQVSETHIQWRLVNEVSWTNLIALSELIGPQGKNIELQTNSTHLQYRVVGDTEWINLIALTYLTGPAGKSAYQYYLDGGGIKTESEFIVFLNGTYADINHNHNTVYEPKNNNIQSHISDPSIHQTKATLDTYYEAKNSNIQNHISDKSNPHDVTKSQVGLGNVDNTSDANKPLSNAEVTALSNKVDKEAGKGLSQENYTTEEKTKLASLAPDKWLGEFPSLAALILAHPTGIAGNSAYVDEGEGFPVATYAWDTTDQEWVKQLGETTAETPESVKQKYESNPDTNAFTDSEQTKLSGISSGADVTKDVLTNTTTDNTIDDNSTINFFKLVGGVQTLYKTTVSYLKTLFKNYFDTVYAAIGHNHNLNDLIEKSYNSLSDKPDLSSLHTHTNKTDLDNYDPDNFAAVNHNHDTVYSPTGHNHDSIYSPTGHNHDSIYEAKNSNIQTHIADTTIHIDSSTELSGAIDGTNDKIIIKDASASKILLAPFTALYTYLKGLFDSIYQAVLVSGTNLKTINGNSLLGSGDLSISGGSSGSSLWTAITATRTSNNTFTLSGDQTLIFQRGLIIRWLEGSTNKLAMVVSSSYSSPTTTVTICGDTCGSTAATFKYCLLPCDILEINLAGTIGNTGTNVARTRYPNFTYRLLGADMQVTSAGSSGSLIVDINQNGNSLFGTKLTLSTGTYTVTPQAPYDSSTLVTNYKITADIDQIHSLTYPVDLYIQLYVFQARLLNIT